TNVINTDFVDPNKPPSYYIERYYSEPEYKSWFDRNYPGQTIEETVGYAEVDKTKSTADKIVKNEIIPEAQASSIIEIGQNEDSDSDIAKIVLALGTLAVLFGAVYGVKRQVDSNSRQISINKETIREKIIRPIRGSTPKEIIQTRLAKGEISLEEYEQLKSKLN
ncbi:MAG TPA: SHOCT domain-containing protein, partial [Nitrosopumilus sp.]|nr:SHOCT domain-containing protein [Nitrosopumilus sp.]